MTKPRASEPLRRKLIDARSGLRVEEWRAGPRDLDLGGDWEVHKHVLHGGRQEGVDVVRVANGVLEFVVVPTRGMGLWEGRSGDLRLGWDSPVDEVVHPQFVSLERRGGLGWLEGFGEWINRCGLESNGLPGEDRVVSNTGAVVPVQLTLHGKSSYIPASEVEVEIEAPPSRRIRIRGLVKETMMFGAQLELRTEISTEVGSKSLTIRDQITNRGAAPQEMQLLYHSNFGAPLLEEGAELLAPLERVVPRDVRAAEGGMERWNRYGPPQPGYVEQVYFLRLRGAEDGATEALLRNRAGDRGVSLAFSLRELPYLTVWKNTAAREDGYVTGIEPGTNYPNLRRIEREKGRVPKLGPGETYQATLTVTALTSAAEVEAAAARVRKLQGDHAAQVLSAPED
jgi:hypothetical protein